MKNVCVFCGSSTGRMALYQEAAQALGQELARRGLGLIYGGGNVGLMGILADAAISAGGAVTGVIPDFLVAKELAHTGLTKLHVVTSMHARKAMMARLSDAFIALPGGYGTFEEFCEMLTWDQLGIHAKPNGLLNIAGYYDPLIKLFDHAVDEQFLDPTYRALVQQDYDPARLLDALAAYQPVARDKWADRQTPAVSSTRPVAEMRNDTEATTPTMPLTVDVRLLAEEEIPMLDEMIPLRALSVHQERFDLQQRGEAIYLIAWSDGRPVGHILLKWRGSQSVHIAAMLKGCPEIEDMLVAEAVWSRGVGSRLLAEAETMARLRGYRRVGLGVGTGNTRARILYDRRGYVDVGLGPYTETGSYIDRHGQENTWAEMCVYLVKQLNS